MQFECSSAGVGFCSIDTPLITALRPLPFEPGPVPVSCPSIELWQLQCLAATVARKYQDYSYDYSSHGQDLPEDGVTEMTDEEYQQLLAQGFRLSEQFTQTPTGLTAQVQHYPQHDLPAVLPSQVTAAEPAYSIEQPSMLSAHVSRHMSQASSSHYGSPYESPQMLGYHPNLQPSRKRSFQEDFYDYQDLHQTQQLQPQTAIAGAQVPMEHSSFRRQPHYPSEAMTYRYPSQRPSPHPAQPIKATQSVQQQQQHQPQHHHHRLPNLQPPAKMARTSYGANASPSPSLDGDAHGPPNLVGQPGMPSPAARPRGPKLKFTPEDDALLVELKETKDLTWKQIADFFPGRTSGTLQVRYCTKLKAKTAEWTDEMVQRLRTAMEEYDHDRWRVISGKVGNGFSAAACKEKALDLEVEEAASAGEEDDEEEGDGEENSGTDARPSGWERAASA